MSTSVGARGFDVASVRLIAITDSLRDGPRGLALRAAAAAFGGATMIQLRLKEESARSLVEIARAILMMVPDVPLIVNDRADVALAAGAAGVHVGVDDLAPALLRRVVPPGFIIGASVGSEDEVGRAAGADYVGIGPVYATGSKADAGAAIGPSGFADLARRCGLPAVAIGGISSERVGEVMSAGASGVAVISALFAAPDPTLAARALRSALDANGR
ncbi:MAG TPA: thiamine phosphate synthase [Gemmatimonadaceae bacterium]|nr:thiamine phosphate synthase [Gemmatimonadaceae bacterium]